MDGIKVNGAAFVILEGGVNVVCSTDVTKSLRDVLVYGVSVIRAL